VINPKQDHVYDKAEAERADPQRKEREAAINRYAEFSGCTVEDAASEVEQACMRAAHRFGYTRAQTYAAIVESIELEIRRDDAEVFALLRRRDR
jgi:hypothetical protein